MSSLIAREYPSVSSPSRRTPASANSPRFGTSTGTHLPVQRDLRTGSTSTPSARYSTSTTPFGTQSRTTSSTIIRQSSTPTTALSPFATKNLPIRLSTSYSTGSTSTRGYKSPTAQCIENSLRSTISGGAILPSSYSKNSDTLITPVVQNSMLSTPYGMERRSTVSTTTRQGSNTSQSSITYISGGFSRPPSSSSTSRGLKSYDSDYLSSSLSSSPSGHTRSRRSTLSDPFDSSQDSFGSSSSSSPLRTSRSSVTYGTSSSSVTYDLYKPSKPYGLSRGSTPSSYGSTPNNHPPARYSPKKYTSSSPF